MRNLVIINCIILIILCIKETKTQATPLINQNFIITAETCPFINHFPTYINIRNPKILRVLSVDGGGVRGIIPARILEEFEKRSGKSITELFDIMVGTSTGGLIVLSLNIPDKNGRHPKYKAKDILDMYMNESKRIFASSFGRKLYTGWGLWGPKYASTGYEEVLKELFGDQKMSKLLKPVAVLSYDFTTNLPHIWAREYARQMPHRDFYVRDIAAATSAAPTYFAPKELIDSTGLKEYQVDGGIYANNPQSLATIIAFEMYEDTQRQDLFIVSLGTGKTSIDKEPKDFGIVGWMNANLIDVIMNATSEWEDSEIAVTYPSSCRMQLNIGKEISKLDDASNDNLNSLLKITEQYIDYNSKLIDKILFVLSNPR